MRSDRRIKRYMAPLFTLLVFFCSYPGNALARQQADVVTSLVMLLTNPEAYDGKVVGVVGYPQLGPGLPLYLTRDHAKARDIASAIELEQPDASPGKCAGAYVQVIGRFGQSEYGDFLILQTLSIDRLTKSGLYEQCWERPATPKEP